MLESSSFAVKEIGLILIRPRQEIGRKPRLEEPAYRRQVFDGGCAERAAAFAIQRTQPQTRVIVLKDLQKLRELVAQISNLLYRRAFSLRPLPPNTVGTDSLLICVNLCPSVVKESLSFFSA